MVSCFESRNRETSDLRSTRCCEKFIELLSSLPERFGVRLHGYALMGNHYHLQLESREANLSKALHWLNVSYSVWFNRKYSRVGPLFQGTFQSHSPRANGSRVHRFRFRTSYTTHLRKSALIVAHASNRLVVGQNTNLFCVLYRRDPF
jgi:Transposase IS200 like